MDLIYREEVHDLIAKRLSDYLTDESRKELEELDIRVEEDIPTVQVPKWIPVSERLPEDHENVLIWLKSNHITIGLYNSHKLPCDDRPIGWGVDAEISVHNFRSDDVLAWMPLPKPYKESDKE